MAAITESDRRPAAFLARRALPNIYSPLNGSRLPVEQAIFPIPAARSRSMSDSFKTEPVPRTYHLHHDDHENEEGQP
jgi:hypothetical protein